MVLAHDTIFKTRGSKTAFVSTNDEIKLLLRHERDNAM